MGFLAKYIAIVLAFLSVAKLGESMKIKIVDATDADSVQDYADVVKQSVSEGFDPMNTEHLAAVGKDAETLEHLLQLSFQGCNMEMCEPKEGDRSAGATLFAITQTI